MSVYSGFATRQQETFYNKLLDRMIQLISIKLLQSMKKIEELTSTVQQPRVTDSTAVFGSISNIAPLNTEKVNNNNFNETNEVVYASIERKEEGASEMKLPESVPLTTLHGSPEHHQQQRRSFIVIDDNDRKWLHHIRKIFNALHNMDKHKYLEPKFSQSLYPVMKFLQKRYPGNGSTMTNISMLSQSQRGGGPLQMPANIFSNFNDTNSLSSLISHDTSLIAKQVPPPFVQIQSNQSDLKSQVLSYHEKSAPIFVDDKKEDEVATLSQQPQNTFSVIEQCIEEDNEEKVSSQKKHERPVTEQPRINIDRCAITLEQDNTKQQIIKPVLKARHTSRTIHGYNSQLIFSDSGVQSEQHQKALHVNETSTIYNDQKFAKYQYFKSIPGRNTSSNQKANHYLNDVKQHLSQSGFEGKMPQFMLDNAYKTAYPNVNINNVQLSFRNYQQNQTNKHNQFIRESKGRNYVKTLIQKANSKNTRKINPSDDEEYQLHSAKTLPISAKNPASTNTSMISQQPPLTHNEYENQNFTPKNTIKNRQLQRSTMTSFNHHQPQAFNDQILLSSQKYGQPKFVQGNVSTLGNNQLSQGKTVMSRNQSEKKRLAKKVNIKTGRNIAKKQYQHSILDNVYNPDQEKLTRIALQVVNRSRAWEDSDSNNSQRSLQKSYLQNLSELVKIHQEMKYETIKPKVK